MTDPTLYPAQQKPDTPTQDATALLPCPFCGGAGRFIDYGACFSIGCPEGECPSFVENCTYPTEFRADMVGAWNTRTSPAASQTQQADVRGAVIEALDLLQLQQRGRAKAFRLLDQARAVSDPATLAQADAYEECGNELRAALSTSPATDAAAPVQGDGVREALAKIIDPDCASALITERKWCEQYGKNFETFAQGYIQRWDSSLAKADAILFALSGQAERADTTQSVISTEGDGEASNDRKTHTNFGQETKNG